ncbi:phosphatase 2C-domain-containing protein [Cantharellus anzutake]|uniref:phosphatase 2C-domain-containing protein n=1 Tax=Cantharellus anzutake TaxID=1750568 RepID=UPI001904BD32|nr:phosphatase 2C-domain-containing protein [Cantharellus anzutake]KAF8332628.1 phosphatase 2C-domain-containing protein [Cantharellus anzutake]
MTNDAQTTEHNPNTPRPGVTPLFTDSPHARSKTITTAIGPYTHGILNQHPSHPGSYSIGVSCDTGSRRTMEDAHSFVADFAGVRGQGYWAVFDGHAGKHAAEWCGAHFHEYLLDALAEMGNDAAITRDQPTGAPIPDVLNKAFHAVDAELSRIAEEGQTHSGCTAVTAFLRLEDHKGWQPPEFVRKARSLQRRQTPAMSASVDSVTSTSAVSEGRSNNSGSRVRDAMRDITGRAPTTEPASSSSLSTTLDGSPTEPTSQRRLSSMSVSSSWSQKRLSKLSISGETVGDEPLPTFVEGKKRVLYTANAGDARAVLSRSGTAVRLTYDHKGSDAQEAKRIKEAGGFVMNNRVNGVLAVTRSLGDSAMKEFIVGSPYTTETTLGDDDDLLIIACDGLWDVIEDQAAVDLIRPIQDPQLASKRLVEYALSHFSSDNISVIVVRFHPSAEEGVNAAYTAVGS